jgi:hypothetical protein
MAEIRRAGPPLVPPFRARASLGVGAPSWTCPVGNIDHQLGGGGVFEADQTCCLTSSVRSPNVLISLLESDLWTFTTSPGLRSRTAFSASRSKENPAMNQCSSGAAPPSCGVTTFTIHPA